MPWLTPLAAYVHIPFCAHHCGYCDFAVSAGQDHLIELYLDALRTELQGEPTSVETIFIGGGTPTHLNPQQLGQLLTMIRERFTKVEEFSVESTPESVTPEKVRLLAEAGVTRVSVGIQSFQANTLAALDRRHGVEQIHRAVSAVRSAKLELSLDLIFAAPGQTLDDWTNDLRQALAFEPDHVSTYGLTFEKGTPLWKARRRGEVRQADEELELNMYEAAIDRLTAAGYEQYEISNFARPGRRCRHNEHYWANHAYHGFGVGAAQYVNGVRSINIRDTKSYIRKVLACESAVQSSECLDPRERAVETLAVQLRRSDGVMRTQFERQTSYLVDRLSGDAIQHLVKENLLADNGEVMKLTRKGHPVADGIIEALIAAAQRNEDPTSRAMSFEP